MFQVSICMAVLAGVVERESRLTWHSDYTSASARAAAEQKPLAVFIDSGPARGGRIVVEGSISNEAAQLLSQKYICVYLDTATSEGRELAGSFEMERGLVISNAGGTKQALRHVGQVASTDLNRYVQEYAEPSQPVVTTLVGSTFAPAPRRRTPIRNIVNAVLPDPFAPQCRTCR